jgi:hypothetical protein
MSKPVSIWDVAPPPYEQYLYVMANFDARYGAMVAVGFETANFKTLAYPAQDIARARTEAQELATLIATTRSLLGLKFHAEVRLI